MNNASCYTFNSSQCRQSDASCSGDQSPLFRHYSTFTKKSNQKSIGSTKQQFYVKGLLIKTAKQQKKSTHINSKHQIIEDLNCQIKKTTKLSEKIKKKANQTQQNPIKKIRVQKEKLGKKKIKKNYNIAQCYNPQKFISSNLAAIRDYIIIDQQIYQCDDLNKVNQQLSFGQVNNLYSYSRYQRVLKQNFMKIQKYIKGFIQNNKFDTFANKEDMDINQLSEEQKLKLYSILSNEKLQLELKKQESSNQSIVQQKQNIQQFIRAAMQCVQEKYQKLQCKYPTQVHKLLKWKNQKYHQIQTVNQFVIRNWQSNNSDQLAKETQSLNIIFEEELEQLLNQQHYFPQIRNQSKALRTSLVNHLQLEKYPDIKQQEESLQSMINKVQQQSKLSKQYFGPAGFLWFANSIKSYIKAMPVYFSQILNNLQRNYRLTKQMKKQLLNQSINLWQPMLERYGETIQMQYPLGDEVFINFSRDVIGSETQDSPEFQNKQKMHIFNKSIIDAINEEMQKYLFGYPYGEPLFLRYIDPPIMTQYTITEYSFEAVWDKCMNAVYQSVCLMAGPIVQQQGIYSSRAQLLRQQLIKFKNYKQNSLLKVQIKQQYEYFSQLLPLHIAKFHYQLAKSIQDMLIEEFFFEIS